MIKTRRARYYIDENVLLVTTIGGKKRTGAGGIVTKSQNGFTCRTCFALIGANHLDTHTKTHFYQPTTKSKKENK